jgi:hypothetical protein
MAADERLRLRRIEDHAWLVEISGEHDMSTAPMLAEQFESLSETGSLVVADITETTFIDSKVIRVFETATQRAAKDRPSASPWSSTSNKATPAASSTCSGQSPATSRPTPQSTQPSRPRNPDR